MTSVIFPPHRYICTHLVPLVDENVKSNDDAQLSMAYCSYESTIILRPITESMVGQIHFFQKSKPSEKGDMRNSY